MQEVTKKLADISNILGVDGYKFCQVRFALEKFEKEGSYSSEYIMKVVNEFHKLLLVLTK